MEKKKTLTFIDLIGFAFAAVFSMEVVASQAAMGPSLIFCFLFFGFTYFVSHALLCAELGSTYPEQGGIYAWVKRAFGDKWAARSTWWYWVNVAAYIPSTFVIMGTVFKGLIWPDLSVWGMVILCIISTWVVVLLNCMPLSFSKWMPSLGAICKTIASIALIFGAGYYLVQNGSNTEFSWGTIIPNFDLAFFALVPVYVYSLTGFDLMSTAAAEMENPKRDVPRSVFFSGGVTLLFYIIAACAVLIVIPQAQVNESSGFIDAIIEVYGNSKWLLYTLGISSVIAYVGSVLSWALGGNKAAQEAAEYGELPKIFAKTNKHGSPVGSAIILGICSTVLLVVYGFVATSNEGLFWSLLAFTSIIFFLPYIVMSFTFIVLRKKDVNINRPFKIPGPNWVATCIALLHCVFLIVSIVFFFIPPAGSNGLSYILTLGIGVLVTVLIGEYLVTKSINRRDLEENQEDSDAINM